jgi:hypothetical protein
MENIYELFYIGDKNNLTIAGKDNWYVSSHLLNVKTSGREGTETKQYLIHKCVCTRHSNFMMMKTSTTLQQTFPYPANHTCHMKICVMNMFAAYN